MAEAFDPKLVDDGVDDNPVRGTVALTDEERSAREREKQQILGGIHVGRGDHRPQSRRRTGGPDDREWPDMVARHEPTPPTREELAKERETTNVEVSAIGRYTGAPVTIEDLARVVKEDEARLKASKAALRKALKKIL